MGAIGICIVLYRKERKERDPNIKLGGHDTDGPSSTGTDASYKRWRHGPKLPS